MPELTVETIEQVLAALPDKLAAIGESLNQCFDTKLELSLGESLPLSAMADAPALGKPGVIVSISVGSAHLLCAITASLPLPEWYTTPDKSQTSRLETLGMEWSMNCLPDDFTADKFGTHTVPDLLAAIRNCSPDSAAIVQPLLTAASGGTPSENIWLIGPVEREPVKSEATGKEPVAKKPPVEEKAPPIAAEPTPEPAALPPVSPAIPPAPPRAAPAPRVNPRSSHRLQRLLNVPVPIVVQLAEKKIEVGQLLALGPGAIVTFDKSCEELLELHVNNQLYCRGEAVKIGEKFGLKITEVGSVRERVSAVLHPSRR